MVKGGGVGDKKRGLTSLIKSRLVCGFGRHQLWWWRKRRRRWRVCGQNAVQPGADVGVKEREKKKSQDCWMYSVKGCISKEEPLPSVHPPSQKSPYPLDLSSSECISHQVGTAVFLKMDNSWQMRTHSCTIDRSILCSLLYIFVCVCRVLRWSVWSYQCMRIHAAVRKQTYGDAKDMWNIILTFTLVCMCRNPTTSCERSCINVRVEH